MPHPACCPIPPSAKLPRGGRGGTVDSRPHNAATARPTSSGAGQVRSPTRHPRTHTRQPIRRRLPGTSVVTRRDNVNLPTLHLLPRGDITGRHLASASQKNITQPPTPPRLAEQPDIGGNRGESTAYPQQIVTTRLLYCLQDRFAQLSRLQRI